uniref:Uncharacterized protein n=1 Tax=Timema poppense TaxID=170557 RepID=A0A7R9DMH4_TIMPO|nr:unnamed protein product [Timema poppensis]
MRLTSCGWLRVCQPSTFLLCLCFTVESHVHRKPIPEQKRGQISVNNPYGFPAASETIHVASIGQVSVSANVMHATSRVRTMSVVNRRCLYHDERSALGMHTYNEQNCVGECHLNHSVQYCNCSPYFYPTRDSIKSCDVIGYMCLAAFNEVFNYVKPAENNPYFDNSTLGMVCDCMSDCHSVDYISEIYTTDYGSKINFSKEKNAFVDVHFKQPTSVMYRTDIVFGWLELMGNYQQMHLTVNRMPHVVIGVAARSLEVSLGGLAGLFLGCSMLSGVELLYFFTIRLFFVWSATRCRDNPQRRKAKKGAYLTPPTNKNTVLNESQAYFI